MIKKGYFLLIFFVFFLIQTASYSYVIWTKITEDKDAVWFVDLESIELDSNYIDYWSKIKFKKTKKNTKFIYAHIISDCYRSLISVTEMSRYNVDENFLEHHSSRNYVQFTPVLPDTALFKVHKLACRSATFRD